MMECQKRNLNPTVEARIAMVIWGKEYSQQGGGSMDFWDALPEDGKRMCKMIVNEVLIAQQTQATDK